MPKEFKFNSQKYMFIIIMNCYADNEYRKYAYCCTIHVSHKLGELRDKSYM